MSQDEKDKMVEGNSERREKDNKDKLSIKRAEQEIFNREKDNLPLVLKQRLEVIETALEKELADVNGLKSARIHQLISRQAYYSISSTTGYSAQELFIVFQVYQDVIDKINQKVLFIPSQKNFCSFAGFSTNTYKNYLQSPDDDKRNVMQMVDDYISDLIIDASKMRKTDNSSSIFELKALHQMAEAVNPQVINLGGQINVDQVLDRIAQIKQGNVIDADFKEKGK